MIKLTKRHQNSLARAIVILRLKARNQPIPKFRREWERDIRLMNQIAQHVDDLIDNPMLSFYEGHANDGSKYVRP